MSKSMNDVINELNEKIGSKKVNEKDLIIAIIAAAGKAGITEKECREKLNLYSEDKEKDTALKAKYLTQYLKPLKIVLTMSTFKISEEQALAIWKKGNDNEEDKARRDQIISLLPKREKRPSSTISKLGQFLSELL